VRCVIVGGRLPEIAFQTVTGSITAETSYTFSSQPIGTAHTSRRVIVSVIYFNSAPSSATCTIAGVSAAEVGGAAIRSSAGGSGNEFQMKMFIATVASGTTASIVVNTGPALGCWIAVWSAYYLQSATAVDAEAYFATGTTNILDLNVSADGVACGFGAMFNAVSWTGMTEDFEDVVAGFGHWRTAATYSAGAAESPRTVRINTNPGVNSTANAASFR